MGKASRANTKKAVKRSRRAILEEQSTLLLTRERAKQEVLKRILSAPKPDPSDGLSSARALADRRRSRVDQEDENSEDGISMMKEPNTHMINVTRVNAAKRQRRRFRYLRTSHRRSQFVVAECTRQKIAKKRNNVDVVQRIEANLGLTKATTADLSDSSGRMDVSSIPAQRSHTKKLAPGSQWLRFKKPIVGQHLHGKGRIRKRYRMTLKGITQYYPTKSDSMPIDE